MPHSIFKIVTIVGVMLTLLACETVSKDPTREWTAKDFYDQARSALDAGEFQSAIKHLEQLDARFPFDKYAKQAQLDVAYAYYKFDEPDETISAIQRFIHLYPRDAHLDYAYYLKGLADFNRGKGLLEKWAPNDMSQHDRNVIRDALNSFSLLIRRFPGSKYAPDAHQRMIFLRNELAQYEISIAEFYIDRKIWLAAANRANYILENYQQSPYNIRALEILILAYRNLELDDLALDVQHVLDLNSNQAIETAKPSLNTESENTEPPVL